METQEESAQRRKINCECMKRKRLFETQEESAKRKKTIQEYMTKQWQTETEEEDVKRKKTKRDCMAKQRQTETEVQGAKRKKTKRDIMRRKREEMRHRFLKDGGDCTGEDMTNVINRATKEAKQFLHRTRDPANPTVLCPIYGV